MQKFAQFSKSSTFAVAKMLEKYQKRYKNVLEKYQKRYKNILERTAGE